MKIAVIKRATRIFTNKDLMNFKKYKIINEAKKTNPMVPRFLVLKRLESTACLYCSAVGAIKAR